MAAARSCPGRQSTAVSRTKISSDDIDSLGVVGTLADLRATAILTDITNRRKPIVVASNLTLHIAATERNAPAADSIGIALWAGNRLVTSSRWTGFSTLEQALNGGLLTVR